MKSINDLNTKYPLAFETRTLRTKINQDHLIRIRDGWYDLVEPIIQYIHEYNSIADIKQITIIAIKQKYGGLRVYYNSEDHLDFLDNLVSFSEEDSFYTCEFCGESGILRKSPKGWLHTSCNKHEVKE